MYLWTGVSSPSNPSPLRAVMVTDSPACQDRSLFLITSHNRPVPNALCDKAAKGAEREKTVMQSHNARNRFVLRIQIPHRKEWSQKAEARKKGKALGDGAGAELDSWQGGEEKGTFCEMD